MRTNTPNSPSPLDWSPSIDWKAHIARQSVTSVLRDAELAISRIQDPTQRSSVVRTLPMELLLHMDGARLRRMLTDEDALDIYSAFVMRSDATKAHLITLIDAIAELDRESTTAVWRLVIKGSPHVHFLSKRMPRKIAQSIRKTRRANHSRKSARFLKHMSRLEPYDTSSCVSFDSTQLYPTLDERDWTLARLWAGENATEWTIAKMIAARAAEVAAARFYRELGQVVDDVAIQQLDRGVRREWVTHDLLLDGRTPVDVKNARTRTNSAGAYAEHAIPEFKEDRAGTDVAVVGVRSPYLRLSEIQQQSQIPQHRDHPVLVLGECTRKELASLRAEFTSPMLHDITLGRPGRRFSPGGRRLQELLPPWVFQYPGRFYEQASICQYRASVCALADQPLPEAWLLAEQGLNPVPLYLQAGVLPESMQTRMESWEVDLARRLVGRVGHSLPRLFLTLLTDFLDATVRHRSDYEPERYRHLVFPRTGKGDEEDRWAHMPLGIVDPMRTIHGLIRTLHLLWKHRHVSRLLEFTRFQFTVAGMLRGLRVGEVQKTTLLAYCGGQTPNHGPCGNSPLILGEHMACVECRFLICEKCGFCRMDCAEGELRQERMAEDAK